MATKPKDPDRDWVLKAKVRELTTRKPRKSRQLPPELAGVELDPDGNPPAPEYPLGQEPGRKDPGFMNLHKSSPHQDLSPEQIEFIKRLDPKQREEFAQGLKVRILEKCRQHFPTFAQYVLKDEETFQPIEFAAGHWQLCDLMERGRLYGRSLNSHLRKSMTPDELRVAASGEGLHRLVVMAHVEFGKSTLVTIGYVLWRLGREPALRVGIISKSRDLAAEKFLTPIAQYIEESEELHEVFPDLRPSTRSGDKWQPASSITVERPRGPQSASVTVYGTESAILSSRLDLIIADDVQDKENTRTDHQRNELRTWWTKMPATRFTRAGQGISNGVPHHPEDLQGHLTKHGWRGFRFSAETEDGKPTHPRWNRERLDRALIELGVAEYERSLRCRVRADSMSRFNGDSVKLCLAAGNGYRMVARLADLQAHEVPEGSVIAIGVDLAVKRNASSDDTVIFTLLGLPDGRRRPLWIEAGKKRGRQIIQAVKLTFDRFPGAVVFVEDDGAQDFLVQQMMEELLDLPIRAHNTGASKHDAGYGVESLAAELDAARWMLPNIDGKMHRNIYRFQREILFFDPHQHSGDVLMAGWIARQGVRELQQRGKVGSGLDISLRVLNMNRAAQAEAKAAKQRVERHDPATFHEISFTPGPFDRR